MHFQCFIADTLIVFNRCLEEKKLNYNKEQKDSLFPQFSRLSSKNNLDS